MKTRAQFLKGCARTLVLGVLSERPMYGYEIATVLAQRSDSIFELGQGTLYPMLYSLQRKGLIRVERKVRAADTGRRRVYYALTAKGRAVLAEDLDTWSSIERGMGLVLRGAHG